MAPQDAPLAQALLVGFPGEAPLEALVRELQLPACPVAVREAVPGAGDPRGELDSRNEERLRLGAAREGNDQGSGVQEERRFRSMTAKS